MNQRLQEIARLGFKKVIIPQFGSEKLEIPDILQVYRVRNLREAIEISM
jgi:predicted ATP-dependent serine protease